MGFFGGSFLVQRFWVLLEALTIFLGFDFCPHSIIPALEIQSTPLGFPCALHAEKIELFWCPACRKPSNASP